MRVSSISTSLSSPPSGYKYASVPTISLSLPKPATQTSIKFTALATARGISSRTRGGRKGGRDTKGSHPIRPSFSSLVGSSEFSISSNKWREMVGDQGCIVVGTFLLGSILGLLLYIALRQGKDNGKKGKERSNDTSREIGRQRESGFGSGPADVIIVGAGVAGSALAHTLGKVRGVDSLLSSAVTSLVFLVISHHLPNSYSERTLTNSSVKVFLAGDCVL